jgi:hypothetical protein
MAEVVRITVPAGAAMAEVTCFEARHYVSSLPRHLRHWDRMAKVWPVALRITRIPPVSTVQGGRVPALVPGDSMPYAIWVLYPKPPSKCSQMWNARKRNPIGGKSVFS